MSAAGFSEAQLAAVSSRLQQLRDELIELVDTAEAAAGVVELDQSRVGRLSRMDALQGQAMSLEAKRRRQIELAKIGAALQRLETGDYGYCVKCGEETGAGRLEHDPAAPLCISCASALEQ